MGFEIALVAVAVFGFLAYHRFPLWVWTGIAALFLGGYTMTSGPAPLAWTAFAALAVVLNVPFVRRLLISNPVLNAFRDQTLFLKHNLNAQAIAALNKTSLALKDEVNVLIRQMEASILEANAFIDKMRAGGGS